MLAHMSPAAHDRVGSEPAAVADPDGKADAALLRHRDVDTVVHVVAAHEVDIGREHDVLPNRDLVRGEDFAVEADIGPLFEVDIPVLARKDRVPPDEDPVVELDPRVVDALRVEEHVVVHHHVVSDADFSRVAQHDILPEHDVPAAGAEKTRVELASEKQPKGPRDPSRQEHHELVADNSSEPRSADDELAVFLDLALIGIRELFLGDRDTPVIRLRG